MILGGFIGFLIGIGFGLAQQSAWPEVIWRASVAALLAGILLRWWGRVWIKNLHQANQQRLAPEAKPDATPVSGPAKP
jgi:hypothetical protein